MSLGVASELVVKAFAGKVDKANKPYTDHLFTVASLVYKYYGANKTLITIALLHDIVEDTEYTLDDLKALGFSDRVVSAVDAITKRDGEKYEDYLGRIAKNTDAIVVKLCDIEHNSDLSRLPVISEDDVKRIDKYIKAVTFLKKYI